MTTKGTPGADWRLPRAGRIGIGLLERLPNAAQQVLGRITNGVSFAGDGESKLLSLNSGETSQSLEDVFQKKRAAEPLVEARIPRTPWSIGAVAWQLPLVTWNAVLMSYEDATAGARASMWRPGRTMHLKPHCGLHLASKITPHSLGACWKQHGKFGPEEYTPQPTTARQCRNLIS